MKKKRICQIIFSIVVFYVILTILLYVVETIPRSAGSSITSLGDAAWYLLATLTTVGYGDITPVTAAGKLIGAVMMISSAGVLTFLLGLVFTLLFGRFLPSFRLWLYRRSEWYVFSELDESTQLLASKLAQDAPNATFVFHGKEENLSQEHFPTMRHFVIVEDPIETIIRRQDPANTCNLFLMSQDGWENYRIGCKLLERITRSTLRLYCNVDHGPDRIPAGMVLFDRPDAIARSYWNSYPTLEDENVFVMIGDGKIARRLLERGLLINVLPMEHPLEYHVFGDWEDFKRDHYELSAIVGINEKWEGEDSIFFEEGPWNASAEMLRDAHRIIICGDDQEENLSLMAKLRRYFPTLARVDVYTGMADERCRIFGGDDQLLSREMVMQEKINQLAVRMNEHYREKTGAGQGWTELSEFHRQSNIAAADHILTKIRLLLPKENVTQATPEYCTMAYEQFRGLSEEQKEACRWIEHKRWVRFHVVNNWGYAEKRDNLLRRHPLLIPYEELSHEEQILDDSAWEILGEMN
ncbi:MAG: ion transporter [Lachnospiraceae bacterium]|nr:ion transporter [Lachnospiraceae bacterium]